MNDYAFDGFNKKTVTFFKQLAKNNNREWFESNREMYDRHVMEPSRGFVVAMGERLREIAPGIHAEPKVNKALFRIHRDTRFSSDKSPYKTHLGIFLWEGRLAKMECPGFYFHLEPPDLMLGAGLHIFSRRLLKHYRDTVTDPHHGAELLEAVAALRRNGIEELGGKHYKRVPRGYDPDPEIAGLMLYNGLYVSSTSRIPDELFSADIVDYCFGYFKSTLPLHKWLLGMTERL